MVKKQSRLTQAYVSLKGKVKEVEQIECGVYLITQGHQHKPVILRMR